MENLLNEKKLTIFTSNEVRGNLNRVLNYYEQNGVIGLNGYLNQVDRINLLNELEAMQSDAEQDIARHWDNKMIHFYSKDPMKPESEDREYVTEPYFQASSNKAHVFYELIDNVRVVNRIGHGMHLIDKYPMMQRVVHDSPILLDLLKGIGFKKPICHLSVYIPKYPNGTGSEVRPHQESTFAYTKPQTVVVLWIALEDALIENACMYGILGSNHWPLKWLSKVDRETKTRHFEQVHQLHIPDFITEREFYTALEVKAGDALLFHGSFVHCSPMNTSKNSRKALSLQFIETYEVDYPETNWLYPPNKVYLY
ncbi:phytanoyl-CoA dioxygenase family protein [Legionella pneumophila]|uniref:Phytanoyl-CoA dioxygenase n=1 Tax=Legionella pneumophila subsp. pascullei TaxID=91890 RepID=A0AAX2IU72_LEGPN|nr:phytanoyl-CoA dioxygenase family protein [Legionella pneumophila]AMP88659.1 phytanoyl-CoA dioxygenase [Legionella pneumophila subsp. pascullei]AMP91568.1 phytanoyl-CoA dioxygenase [Legionella pneumophila subsp. pascullei]AMP94554.1 phytanoyl-CoA dioxygenase [Legionella pneumophila subsp. pascullei]SQG89362.1 phytanoyl-CoA dioxygenase [Legionella pneumophila subsp. pascullei]VEH04560.1 phytanoyl-CoA dioxygenase [Legionella pneumophila subsp. pascullei]